MFEFHIARTARELYGVSGVLFSFSGNAVFADPAASRAMAHRMNEVRKAGDDPKKQVQPAALFAMGLIDEAAHALFAYYRKNVAPKVLQEALQHFSEAVGEDAVDGLLLAFVERFPGSEVYAGKVTPQQWLAGETDGLSHREVALEELILLWFENRNPSFAPFRELFDDTELAEKTAYVEVTGGLPAFFATQPEVGGGRGGVFELLLAVFSGGGSLSDQLALLRGRWGFAVEDILRRVLLAGDVLKEEEIALWTMYNPPSAETVARRNQFDGWGTTHAEVPNYTTAPAEYEAFSPDQEWMPRTVMIAKSTYVWLNQLSRFYGREVTRLDQIPDEELETLAKRGMNALWLIGVWERSRASQTIKRLCGNADAVASAYSLYDYSIAENLGGDWAYQNLRDRCARFGIRLASDMVPNHMGIDSTWVVEHPEWFLSRHDLPYPSYTFNGPDLSGDDRVEIKIEDHYYSQTDASVVFMRRDKWTGDTQYIYHGNDGTSFPWNDTAQLNYLSGGVREQVIQTILHVARLFPIIRFDAAMTLAKRHVQRLWFPAPGAGGAIPSRAESAIATDEFDRLLPEEFWREVVDRVAQEVPGTLLLAEAFWLMEGYFVRTLGMHRVYNSAFMVMLRDEDNANYRKVLKNTLEFDPGIMKRYVNFMSNPDERTAVDQFGNGDKCFGVATMMATLPGLPMFGHGQVEGFTEKYGMEYYKPRFEEWPTDWLVERHNREIAPLLHRRSLFAESDNFLLYDLWHNGGGVNENVFAYSNYRDGQRALIVYNNSYNGANGTVHGSVAYMDKGSGQLRQRSIADGLALPNDGEAILRYRDSRTGLQHLRRGSEVHAQGMYFDLGGYGYAVLLDWSEVRSDETHAWGRLCDLLGGRGVADLDRALLDLELEETHKALRTTLEPRLVRGIAASSLSNEIAEEWLKHAAHFIELARKEYFARIQPPPAEEPHLAVEDDSVLRNAEKCNEDSLTETRLRARLAALPRLAALEANWPTPWPAEARTVLPTSHPTANAGAVWAPVLAYTLLAALGESLDLGAAHERAATAFDNFGLRAVLAESFGALNFSGDDVWRNAARVRLALASAVRPSEPEPKGLHAEDVLLEQGTAVHGVPATLWQDGDVRWLAGVNEHEGTTYLNREAFAELVWWRALPELLQLASAPVADAQELETVATQITTSLASAERAGYKLVQAAVETPAPEKAGKPDIKPVAEKKVAPEKPKKTAEKEKAEPKKTDKKK